jgi:hypothetical protein
MSEWPADLPLGFDDWDQHQQIDYLSTRKRATLIRLCLSRAEIEPERRIHSKRYLTKKELAAIYRALAREQS